MLSSPVVVLLAWGGVAALPRARRRRRCSRLAALLALVLVGGTLASDALQYHASDLAPTARFDELAQIDSRFAGRVRRCSPTSTNTRYTCCETSAWRVPTSSIRRGACRIYALPLSGGTRSGST